MFDKEIIKQELEEVISAETGEVNLDDVVENYTMLDGFYCFRIRNDAYIFNDNEIVDSFPGFFGGGASVGGQ